MNAVSLKTIFARLFDAMDRRDLGNAYVIGAASCAPSANAALSLQVNVAAGSYCVNAGTFATFAGGNKTPAAAIVNPHVDLIYIDAAGVLQLVAGVETAVNPIPPVIPAGGLGIALVFVPPGAVDYGAATTAYIFDIRQFNAPMYLPAGSASAPSLALGDFPGSGLFGAGAGKIGLSIAGTKTVEFGSTYMAVGSTPASVGALRLANTDAIDARNAANTADVAILSVDASNRIALGNSNVTELLIASGAVSFGTTPATAGAIRLPNNSPIDARNVGNTLNTPIITMSTADEVVIGGVGSGGVKMPVNYLAVGPTQWAATGAIRLPNISYVVARNQTNTGDVQLIGADGGGRPNVGDTTANLNLSAVAGGVDFRYAVTALGGGAAPTLGTIGGTGPAVAAQHSWLAILINGTASFIPIWR